MYYQFLCASWLGTSRGAAAARIVAFSENKCKSKIHINIANSNEESTYGANFNDLPTKVSSTLPSTSTAVSLRITDVLALGRTSFKGNNSNTWRPSFNSCAHERRNDSLKT
jgi:hypothetical protein